MKVGLIGSVMSSYLTLSKLIEYGFDIIGVWGYEPETIENVSGYCSLREISERHNIPYYPFQKINEDIIKFQILSSSLDILFVVGLSQLVDKDIIKIPRIGCVGFHPTQLPEGRGRAPLAWLVLEKKDGAATFFKIGDGTDNGDIYAQEPFRVNFEDDAKSVALKIRNAIVTVLDGWLPKLKEGIINAVEQDNEKSTYYARRAPLDGCINWYDSAFSIDRLIKASAPPHPGAFTFYDDFKLLVLKSKIYTDKAPKGVIGRVVGFSRDNRPIIQTGDGFVELCEYQMRDYDNSIINQEIVVGSRLGYYEQYELFKLRNELKKIKNKLNIQ
jgi:methionyl-tRNA formyltransferase